MTMKRSCLCLALFVCLAAGCSTTDDDAGPPPAALPTAPKVDPKLEAKVRACLYAIIDDIAAISAEHPGLVSFKPEFIKNGPRMLKARPNVMTSESTLSSFPPMGFSYSYNAVMSRGKAPIFTTDGCLIRVMFFATDPGLKVGKSEFCRGHGVRGTWHCAGDNVAELEEAVKEIVGKHADALNE